MQEGNIDQLFPACLLLGLSLQPCICPNLESNQQLFSGNYCLTQYSETTKQATTAINRPSRSGLNDIFLTEYINSKFINPRIEIFSAALENPTLWVLLLSHWLLFLPNLFCSFFFLFYLWSFGKSQLWSWALAFLICIFFLIVFLMVPHV